MAIDLAAAIDHRDALGYSGKAAPKGHPEYLLARRENRLILNLVDANDPRLFAKEIIDARERLDRIIADHTGQPYEKVRSDTERDYFMSSEEATEYGIIDRVISEH